jgi:hypothetical protein
VGGVLDRLHLRIATGGFALGHVSTTDCHQPQASRQFLRNQNSAALDTRAPWLDTSPPILIRATAPHSCLCGEPDRTGEVEVTRECLCNSKPYAAYCALTALHRPWGPETLTFLFDENTQTLIGGRAVLEDPGELGCSSSFVSVRAGALPNGCRPTSRRLGRGVQRCRNLRCTDRKLRCSHRRGLRADSETHAPRASMH